MEERGPCQLSSSATSCSLEDQRRVCSNGTILRGERHQRKCINLMASRKMLPFFLIASLLIFFSSSIVKAEKFNMDNPNDKDMESVIHIGMKLSAPNCSVTPSPTLVPDASMYVIQCPTNTSELTVEFQEGVSYKQILNPQSRQPIKKLTYQLDAWGAAASRTLMVCSEQKQPNTCNEVQLLAKKRSAEVPSGQRVILFRSTGEKIPLFASRSSEYEFTAYENEPIELMIEATDHFFVDQRSLMPERGFINQTLTFSFRPRGHQDRRIIYFTDKDHESLSSLTLVAKTLPSTNPQIASLFPSDGRFDPLFSSDQYAYYLRVPEGTLSGYLRITMKDDKKAHCMYKAADGTIKAVIGTGLTELIDYGSLNDPAVITLDCWHPLNEMEHVKYLIQVVQEKDGTTLLKGLDLVGDRFQQAFDPLLQGPYVANIDDSKSEKSWVVVRARPKNKKAKVYVDGFPCDDMGYSPYFHLDSRESRTFKVAVRTPRNAVAEVYEISVRRIAPKLWKSTQLASALSWMGTIASATRAYHFLVNFRLIQWLSLFSKVPGTPDVWHSYTALFNDLNFQFPTSDNFIRIGMTEDDFSRMFADSAGRSNNMRKLAEELSDDIGLRYHESENESDLRDGKVPRVVERSGDEWISVEADPIVQLFHESNVLLERQKVLDSAKRIGIDDERLAMEIGNEDFFNCDESDPDLCHQSSSETVKIPKNRLARRLQDQNGIRSKVTSDERIKLEAAYRDVQNLKSYVQALLLTVQLGIVVACVYGLVYLQFVMPKGPKELDRAYLRWLVPVRFWLFFLDILLVAVAQACCGLAFSPLKSTPIYILNRFKTTAEQLGWGCLTLFVLFPLSFIGLVTALVAVNSNSLVFSKTFQRYHDRTVDNLKAFWSPLGYLPVIGRLFDVEIPAMAPVLRAPQDNAVTSIVFNEERRSDAPWFEADSQRALFGPVKYKEEDFRESSSLSNINLSGPDLKYYPNSDKVKIYFDDESYFDKVRDLSV